MAENKERANMANHDFKEMVFPLFITVVAIGLVIGGMILLF